VSFEFARAALPALGRQDRRRRWELAIYACLPTALTLVLVIKLSGEHQLAFDFRREYWVAGLRLLHEENLYAWSRAQIASNIAFPYPPFTAVLFAPAALLPGSITSAVACVGSAACLVGALAVLSVRDWRLYGLVMMWGPVVAGWQSANLSLPFVLALALIWRYRDRPVVTGLIAGVIIALKPFVWPTGLWLLATGRARATLACVVTAGLASAGGLAIAGFSQLHGFLSLDDAVARGALHKSYGTVGLLLGFGIDQTASFVIFGLIACGLAVLVVLAGRSHQRVALLISVLLALAASPLVWTHYLGLLIVPLAIARPRMSVEWLMPLLLWACPEAATDTAEIVVAWVVVGAVAARLILETGECGGPAPHIQFE